jgi:PKHD-type hydroxylase
MWKMTADREPNEAFIWIADVFSKEEIELIINIGKNLPIEDGGVNNNGKAAYETRRSRISWIKPSVNTEFIFHKISDAIHRVNDAYYKFDLTEMEDIQFSEYDESYQGMYRNHTDDGFEAVDRKLSFSLQLSDPADYDGGELLMYRFKLDNPLEVPKQRGLLAAFPSWTIHEVTPVTRGTRYTLVGWCHGPRFR